MNALRRIFAAALALVFIAAPAAFSDETDYPGELVESLLDRIAELEAQVALLEAELDAPDSAWKADDPAAEFSGGSVTVGDAAAEYRTRRNYMAQLGLDPDADAEEIKREVLRDLAEEAILRGKAESLSLLAPDEETQRAAEATARERFDAQASYYAPYQYDASLTDEENEEKLNRFLADAGLSYDEIYAAALGEIWSWQYALFQSVTQDVALTEEELRAAYDRAAADAKAAIDAGESDYDYLCASGAAVYYNPPGYRVVSALFIGFQGEDLARYESLILAMEDENGDPMAAFAQLDALYGVLDGRVREAQAALDAGRGFDEVAAEFSDELTDGKPRRYTVGSGSAELFDEAFLSAAMSLPAVGSLSSPIQSAGGIYILRYESDVPEGAVPYEEVKDALAEEALAEAKQAFYNETVERWLEEANIVYYPERI